MWGRLPQLVESDHSDESWVGIGLVMRTATGATTSIVAPTAMARRPQRRLAVRLAVLAAACVLSWCAVAALRRAAPAYLYARLHAADPDAGPRRAPLGARDVGVGRRRLALTTVLLTPSYVPGAVVLAQSWRDATPPEVYDGIDRVIFVSRLVPPEAVKLLQQFGWQTRDIPLLNKTRTHNKEQSHVSLNFSRLYMWGLLADYDQVLLLDMDALVTGPMWKLLLPRYVPFVGFLSNLRGFNGGMFAFKPSVEATNAMLQLFQSNKYTVRTGGDQDLLNAYLQTCHVDVHAVSYLYNGIAHDYWVDMHTVYFVHYTGKLKPWHR
eukprot:TRINITY_DN3387_c0_g2_i2.p1 TRINITY_DN3387_c0_g2~~TRINITY_DN3387_c0_g2_i2.p1  ORF type:complete len:323 (-),score=83.56 TRINITY_DN3387_c0_g2_i2:311-1279(-)